MAYFDRRPPSKLACTTLISHFTNSRMACQKPMMRTCIERGSNLITDDDKFGSIAETGIDQTTKGVSCIPDIIHSKDESRTMYSILHSDRFRSIPEDTSQWDNTSEGDSKDSLRSQIRYMVQIVLMTYSPRVSGGCNARPMK
jgi:hypothetical protein